MSASRKHNLFGLNVSALNHAPGSKIRQLQATERNVWHVPKVSGQLIKIIKQRLARPRRRLFLKPLNTLATLPDPIYTIQQYVKIMSVINHQIMTVSNNIQHGREPHVPPAYKVSDLLQSFEGHKNTNIYTVNDHMISLTLHDIRFDYNYWHSYPDPNHVVVFYNEDFTFSPYIESLMIYDCLVLTPKAAQYTEFMESLAKIQRYIVNACQSSKAHGDPIPHWRKIISYDLTPLQACYPKLYHRYQKNVINQINYSVQRKLQVEI